MSSLVSALQDKILARECNSLSFYSSKGMTSDFLVSGKRKNETFAMVMIGFTKVPSPFCP